MMDLEAVACQEGDAWHNSAAAAAARMRGPDGFLIFRLDAASAATVQVGCEQPGCSIRLPAAVMHSVHPESAAVNVCSSK